LYEDKLSELQAQCNQVQASLVEAHADHAEEAGQAAAVSGTGGGYEKALSTWESRVEILQGQLSSQRTTAEDKMSRAVREHAKEVASLKAEIDILEGQLQSGSKQNAALATAEEEVDFLRKERETLRSEITDQKKTLVSANATGKKVTAMQSQIDFLVQQNTQLKADKDQCEVEYISLMDVKVALDMEIRAYRLLLENEEHRLEPKAVAVEVEEDTKHTEEEPTTTTTTLKRRRNVVVTPAPKAKRSRQGTARKSTARKSRAKPVVDDSDDDEPPVEPTFQISDMDAKKCVKVTNNTKQQQSLDGWSLKVHSNKKAFFFPDAAAVKPGKTVTVWFGTGKKPRDAVEWDEEDIFAEKDKVFLMSPEGVGHSSVEFSD